MPSITSSSDVNQPVSSLSDLNTGANAFNAAPTPLPHLGDGYFPSSKAVLFLAKTPAAATIPLAIVTTAFAILEPPVKGKSTNILYTGANAPIANPTPFAQATGGPFTNAALFLEKYQAADIIP